VIIKPPKVLCVGRIYCDLVFSGVPNLPKPGQETYAAGLNIFAGGGAFITAAYLSSAGIDVSLCGVLPNGPFGASIDPELGRSGVDLSPCRRANSDEQPQVTVVISSTLDRSFLTRRVGPALPDNFPVALAQPGLTHLHIAELATLVEHPELISFAKQFGLTVSLDCSWDESVLASDNIDARLTDVDLFLPNEPELLKIANAEGDLARSAKMLAASGPVVVVKRGKAGSSLWDANGGFAEAPVKAIAGKDSTGAGDAFNAGFLERWLANASYADCLENGNHFGSAAIQKLGGATAAIL